MFANRRWSHFRNGLLLICLGTACQPSGGALVLEVSQIPAGTQRLDVTVYANNQTLSQHSFENGVAGQSTIELGYRIAEDKLGLNLHLVVEARDAQCQLAQGSADYTVSAPERYSLPLPLVARMKLSGPDPRLNLTAVHGSDENNVWATSADGKLIQWDGCGWAVYGGVNNKRLNAVYAVSANDVWAAGDEATIVHYSAGALTQIPSTIAGTSVQGAYSGVWQVAANDVWFVGANAAMNACFLHHWNGSQLEDFSQLCGTMLGSPKIVALSSIWGISSGNGATLYAGGERNMNQIGGGSSVAALIVKQGAANWQAVALNSTIATKAERINSLFGLSKDEVVLGVNFGALIHYKNPDFASGREIVVDAGRSPSIDDTIPAISGDASGNLFLLYAAGTGFSVYRSRGAVTPWSMVSGSVTTLLPDVRSLFAPSASNVFFVGANGLTTKLALP